MEGLKETSRLEMNETVRVYSTWGAFSVAYCEMINGSLTLVLGPAQKISGLLYHLLFLRQTPNEIAAMPEISPKISPEISPAITRDDTNTDSTMVTVLTSAGADGGMISRRHDTLTERVRTCP